MDVGGMRGAHPLSVVQGEVGYTMEIPLPLLATQGEVGMDVCGVGDRIPSTPCCAGVG